MMDLHRAYLTAIAFLIPAIASATVRLGNDVLAETGFGELQGKRVGLLTNPSGVSRTLQTTTELLSKANGLRLVALFAAEHGIDGNIPAGIEFKDSVDQRNGLPVFSLYGPGPVRKPTPAMLKQIDALVYDIQDTGLRSYTFISTLGLAMEACAQAGVQFVVLDRPNPLGGRRVEGPILDTRFRSFVGQWQIPYVHGMTCGELARMINGEGWIAKPCKLTVVPMQGWKRSMLWSDTGLSWVSTSPNVPHGDTPLFLAATGILGELGGISIASGTPLRFQCVSASWLDAARTSQLLNGYQLPGVNFQPITYQQSGGKVVQATRIMFSDPVDAPLMALNFYIWEAIKKVSGRNLLVEALKSGRSLGMFDKVNGTDAIRKAMEAGRSVGEIVNSWKAGEDAFRTRRLSYLIAEYNTDPDSASGDNPIARTPRPTAAKVHIIVAGDTLYRIAKMHTVTVDDLVKANPGVQPRRLRIGQRLKIPFHDSGQ